jgi:hypothetical protein
VRVTSKAVGKDLPAFGQRVREQINLKHPLVRLAAPSFPYSQCA